MALLEKNITNKSYLEQYKEQISERFDNLEQKQIGTMLSMYGTPELVTLSELLGPEVTNVLASKLNDKAMELERQAEKQNSPPSKRGLAARK